MATGTVKWFSDEKGFAPASPRVSDEDIPF